MVFRQQGRTEDLLAEMQAENGVGDFTQRTSCPLPPQIYRQSREGEGVEKGSRRVLSRYRQ